VPVSVDVEGSAVVEAGWMSTSVNVVIKEMSWELVGEHRSTLAEDPIKEVAAMQYLQAFVGDERRRRRRRRGEGGGGTTRTTSVVDMDGRAHLIPPANPTSSAPAGSVSRVRQCVNSVIINLFINDSFHLMKCS
jgi:hypothetical protein